MVHEGSDSREVEEGVCHAELGEFSERRGMAGQTFFDYIQLLVLHPLGSDTRNLLVFQYMAWPH
jgi:hypothetical protein